MSDEQESGADPTANPHFPCIMEDVRNRTAWAKKDAEIVKRRLCERKRKRTKPYPGAPNSVVPIVDDTTREKTDQEMTMISNARVFAHFVPLSADMDSNLRGQAEMAFDTYLRHMLVAMPKIEEANDMKNARGFTVVKVLRTEHPRFGTLPDFEARDIRDIIVPSDTKEIAKSERVTDVFRYPVRYFRSLGEKNRAWKNVDEVITASKTENRELQDAKTNLVDTFGVTAALIGVTTAGVGSETVVVWEHYTYATEWAAKQDLTGRVKKGDKCRIIFSPDAPDLVIAVTPWREPEVLEPLDDTELVRENVAAVAAGRDPKRHKSVQGLDRPWPFIQPRYENRSRFYYDSRGVGQLCMDDQIIATGQQNAKMVMMDYFQLPLFTGAGSKSSTNVSYEPGSFLPQDVKPVAVPTIPQHFDFNVEMHKRAAGRRVGAMSQYEFSGDISNKKRVQKTATEVTQEGARGTMVSSASVDRFNIPWAEVYQQLWDDLRRMKKPLPMIQNMKFVGQAPLELYDLPVLIVPGSNAKTLNPDMQFNRDRAAWDFVSTSLVPYGVVADAQEAAVDILSNWDPTKAARWLKDPEEAGPGGLPPVYQVLQKLTKDQTEQAEMLEAMQKAIEAIGAAISGGPEGGG